MGGGGGLKPLKSFMSSSSALSCPSREHIPLSRHTVCTHILSSEQALALQPAAFKAFIQSFVETR